LSTKDKQNKTTKKMSNMDPTGKNGVHPGPRNA